MIGITFRPGQEFGTVSAVVVVARAHGGEIGADAVAHLPFLELILQAENALAFFVFGAIPSKRVC